MVTKRIQFYSVISLLAIFTAPTTSATNRVPRFETTRMKSTGGAGVASLLLDEATYLNPATIAYYKNSSLYFQKSGLEATQTNSNSTQEFDSMSIIASDAKGLTGGSLSYNTIDYRGQNIKRFSSAFGRPIGEKSSFGVNLSYSKEKVYNESGELVEQDFKQTTFGVAHAISESVTMGVVVYDPFKDKENDTLAVSGMQYVYKGFVSLMFDIGADYNRNLSDTLVWRAATQLKLFNDFFLRFGTFDDKGKMEKGNGAGIGWIQPKLVIELAIQNLDVLEEKSMNQEAEEIKETSFSLSYRF